MKDYLTVGRLSDGCNEVTTVTANSHEDAAQQAAHKIWEQEEEPSGEIYIDVVTDKDFNIETNFLYQCEDFRDCDSDQLEKPSN